VQPAKLTGPPKPTDPGSSKDVTRAGEHAVSVHFAVWQARAGLSVAKLLRRDPAHRQHVIAGLVGNPEPLVAICSYCQRLRDGKGIWGAVPEWVMRTLRRWPQITLTHGICTECAAIHFPQPSAPAASKRSDGPPRH
jgi:hypothetical protein